MKISELNNEGGFHDGGGRGGRLQVEGWKLQVEGYMYADSRVA
jgi:hypothetical protein